MYIKNAIKFYAWFITGLIYIVLIFAKPDLLLEFKKYFKFLAIDDLNNFGVFLGHPVLIDSSECIELMICKNTRSCTQGNYMTSLLIPYVYKTFYICGSITIEAVSVVKLLQYVTASLNLKGFSFFIQKFKSSSSCCIKLVCSANKDKVF